MTNEEMMKEMQDFKKKLQLMKQVNEHNVELLNKLKSAYQSKVSEILDEIEEIGSLLADTTDQDALEARHRLAALLRQHKND